MLASGAQRYTGAPVLLDRIFGYGRQAVDPCSLTHAVKEIRVGGGATQSCSWGQISPQAEWEEKGSPAEQGGGKFGTGLCRCPGLRRGRAQPCGWEGRKDPEGAKLCGLLQRLGFVLRAIESQERALDVSKLVFGNNCSGYCLAGIWRSQCWEQGDK